MVAEQVRVAVPPSKVPYATPKKFAQAAIPAIAVDTIRADFDSVLVIEDYCLRQSYASIAFGSTNVAILVSNIYEVY